MIINFPDLLINVLLDPINFVVIIFHNLELLIYIHLSEIMLSILPLSLNSWLNLSLILILQSPKSILLPLGPTNFVLTLLYIKSISIVLKQFHSLLIYLSNSLQMRRFFRAILVILSFILPSFAFAVSVSNHYLSFFSLDVGSYEGTYLMDSETGQVLFNSILWTNVRYFLADLVDIGFRLIFKDKASSAHYFEDNIVQHVETYVFCSTELISMN